MFILRPLFLMLGTFDTYRVPGGGVCMSKRTRSSFVPHNLVSQLIFRHRVKDVPKNRISSQICHALNDTRMSVSRMEYHNTREFVDSFAARKCTSQGVPGATGCSIPSLCTIIELIDSSGMVAWTRTVARCPLPGPVVLLGILYLFNVVRQFHDFIFQAGNMVVLGNLLEQCIP